MASIYYITDADGEVYELDATLSVKVIDRGSLTSYKIEDGSELSDHYINDNIEISFSGRISDVKSSDIDPDRVKTTDQFITGLQAVKRSKKSFTLTWREDKKSGGVIYQLNNCMFTSLSFQQTPEVGYAKGCDKHAYEVSLNIKQIRYANAAQIVVETSDLFVDLTADKKKGKGSTSAFDDGEEVREPLIDKLGFWKDIL